MRYFSLLLLLTLCLASCNKDKNVLFPLNYQDYDFSIPSGWSQFETHYIPIRNIQSNVDSLFNFHNIDRNSIQQIQPRAARMSSLFASSDYDFIARVEVRIYRDDFTKDYQVLFFRDDVPFNTGKDLDLIPNAVDVKDYIFDGRFNIAVRLQLRDISPEFIENRMDFSFNVL